jgi:hypothetical protein
MDRTEAAQRAERLRAVAVEMDAIVRDIGPKWIRLAHLRNEARFIREELKACLGESTGTVVQS